MMKRIMTALMLSGLLPLHMAAQDDDMYFVPTKENQEKEARSYGMPSNTYYAGSSRNIDDYNRRTMNYPASKDSLGNDIIDFSAVRGVYPDSTHIDDGGDYKLTRRMSRFDDYTPSQAYWDGYRDGRWASPWHYNNWYAWYDYDPWYWDYPYYWGYPSSWYYSGYWGYHRPWYGGWGYYGYHARPWYGGGVRLARNSRPVNHRPANLGGRNFGGYRGTRPTSTVSGTRSSGSFGGSRGSSFGGSRSGGSIGGGGGSFGGGRSASGGRSFGGRK